MATKRKLAPAATSGSRIGQAEKRILVVEDDRPFRHALCKLLRSAGFLVTAAKDGLAALEELGRKSFDLVLLDIMLPRVNGLEVLAQVSSRPFRPKVVIMTADDTPATVLRAVRNQAYQYVAKPIAPKAVVDLVGRALAAPSATLPIEVISARPEWVELLVPCQMEAAERIQSFLEQLDADLAADVRNSVGSAFRELLLNAVEWGGKLDPTRKVRIAYLRARRMLLYRIADPGPGFRPENLEHSALSNQPGKPLEHIKAREKKGLRPGGFGLLMTRAMVDELIYNEAHNEVVFIKYLDE